MRQSRSTFTHSPLPAFLGLGLFLVGMTLAGLYAPHISDTLLLLGGLALLSCLGAQLDRAEADPVSDTITPRVAEWMLLLALALFLGGKAGSDVWFFFKDWTPFPESGLDASAHLVRSLGIAALLLPVLHAAGYRVPTPVVAAAGVGLALWCLCRFASVTHMEPLYRVDHPSFLYRFQSFADTFPNASYYDPNWNGGRTVPFLVASGVWSLGLPLYPLLKLVPIDLVYTPILALVFIGVIPFSGYASIRALGGSRRAAWIAFLLFLVPGRRYFVHALHYGTAPSMFSLALSIPALALLWRLLRADTLATFIRRGLGLTAVLALSLCWPGALLLLFPFIAALAAVPGKLKPRPLLWLGICAGLLILLLHRLPLAPLALSPISAFTSPTPPVDISDHLHAGMERLYGLVISSHPLIIVCGSLWFLADARRNRARFLGLFFLACLIAAGWGEEVVPLLQCERLMIPAELSGGLLAAFFVDRCLARMSEPLPKAPWRRRATRSFERAGTAWVVALLLLGGYTGVQIYGNRTPVSFQTMPPATRRLVDFLKEDVPPSGRILVAGRAVHGYGGAKIAAFPLLTGREMMACDYYGFSPKLVEYQYPPRKVLTQGPEAVFRFLDLYNVSHVITYHGSWIAALDRHPEYYEKRREIGNVSVYRVRHPLSPLLGAHGSVTAEFDRLHVDLETDPDEVVLKYNWSPYWRVPPPASLHPYPAEFGVQLIALRPGGLRQIELTHRIPW